MLRVAPCTVVFHSLTITVERTVAGVRRGCLSFNNSYPPTPCFVVKGFPFR